MGNFFTSLFSSGKKNETSEEKQNGAKNFDVFKYDGVRAQRIGQIPYAIRCFQEALNIQEDFETMSHLASAYTANRQVEEALEVLNRMVELDPDHIDTRLARIQLLFMLDKDAEVISDCSHILELDPSHHTAYLSMAKAKKTTGDLIGAIADLTKAIAHQEDFAEAYLLRAEILLSMGQSNEALADVEKAIELVPEEETAYLQRGRIHEAMGDLQAAANDYQSVLDLNPYNEDACLSAARLLIEGKEYDEAIAFLDDAIEVSPQFAKAYAERGRAKNLKGDKKGAFDDLKISIELDPDGEEAKKINGQHANFDEMYKGGLF